MKAGYLTGMDLLSQGKMHTYRTSPVPTTVYTCTYRNTEIVSKVADNHPSDNVRFVVACIDPSTKMLVSRLAQRYSALQKVHQAISKTDDDCLSQESQMVASVIQNLKEMLKNNKSMTLRDHAEGSFQQSNNYVDVEPHEVASLYGKFVNIRPQAMRDFLLENLNNRKQSQILVKLMDNLEQTDVQLIASNFHPSDIAEIVSIPKSIFFLLKLVSLVPWFYELALQECQRSFWAFISNRATSKLVIYFIENDAGFRGYVFNTCRKHIKEVTKNFAATYILTIAIKNASSDQEYSYLVTRIERDGPKVLNSRYFKRILVSYVEYCSYDSLHHVYNLLGVSANVFQYLSDKYMTYILLMFLKRAYAPFIQLVTSTVVKQMVFLKETKYLYFFLLKAAIIKNLYIRRCLHKTLMAVEACNFSNTTREESFFYLYCYLTLTTATSDQERQQALTNFEASFGLLQEFGMKSKTCAY